jgi:phosphohistidine phosphatase
VKTLILMRHGHAPSASEAGVPSDAARPISEKGRADARRAAEAVKKRGHSPALVLHSPLLRARQTAEIVAKVLGVRAETLKALDNTLPAEEVAAALEARGAGVAEVLAVGHQPQIGELAALLGRQLVEFRPAGAAAVALEPRPGLLWTADPEDA